MTLTIALFVIGLLAGLAGAAALSLLLGKRITRPDGQPGRRRGPLRILLALVAIGVTMTLLGMIGGYLYADSKFGEIERVDVDVDGSSVLQGSSKGTNYLLVGTDAREGTEGNRSDTILILRTGDGPARLLSIPRDLLVARPDLGGEKERINAAYNSGPANLIRTVQEGVGIPIDRYIEINFTAFAGLVDALGGVTINFDTPAIDTHSGLNVTESGPVELDGEQSLAFVRSRFFQPVVDGVPQQSDGKGDLGRVIRQQQFLKAVLAEAGSSRNPFKLSKIGTSLIGGLKIDNHMDLIDALVFAWNMGNLDPVQTELPTSFIEGSGAVDLAPEAATVIEDFST